MPQRGERIGGRGAQRGPQARARADDEERRGGGGDRHDIVRADAVQERLNEPARDERAGRAERDARRDERRGFGDDHPQDRRTRRAHRDADADLARAAHDGIRQQSDISGLLISVIDSGEHES